jgi:type II secretory pathway component PulK
VRRGYGGDGGFVLVCVLWVVAIMMVITLGFGRRAMLENTSARYSLDYVKAMHMARGAANRGIVELRNKAVYDTLASVPGRTSYTQQWSRPRNLLEGGEEGGQFFSDAENEEFQDDICAYAIQDEESRIALSATADEILDEVPGLSRSVIRKIKFRRAGNPDDNQPAQPFQTIEELRFIQGISDEEWFGKGDKPGIKDLVSCFGDGRINVNTASEQVLACIPKVSSIAGAIVDYRRGEDGLLNSEDDRDFASLDDLGTKLRVSGAAMEKLQQYCKVTSEFFTITGTATRRQGKIRATCTATVQVIAQSAGILKWREETIEP